MAVFPWGLEGAALATAISQVLAAVLSLIYFSSKKATVLRMGKPLWEGRTLGHVCANGSSELMSNISMSVVSMLYNIQLLKYAGEDGIAAYGVLMYVNMIFLAIFIGYSTGIAPVVSFHFGAVHRDELKSLLRKSATLIAIMSVCMFVLAELMGRPLAGIFVSYDDALMDLSAPVFAIYSFSFLFSGISIFGSSFFTALNDGLTSVLISFLRSLVFQVIAVLVFPLIWEVDGIWFSIVAAELVSAVVTEVFLAVKRRKYGYA